MKLIKENKEKNVLESEVVNLKFENIIHKNDKIIQTLEKEMMEKEAQT